MRSLAMSLNALCLVSPALAQLLDLDMVIAAPNPTYSEADGATARIVQYDTANLHDIATSIDTIRATTAPRLLRNIKRDDCAQQPPGATGALTVSPDTPEAFATSPDFATEAFAAPVPDGYDQAFVNYNAADK